MPKACTVCRLDRVIELDRMLCGGLSQRAVARKFGVSALAVHRHFHKHLPPEARAAIALK
jgi:hypothetical protein